MAESRLVTDRFSEAARHGKRQLCREMFAALGDFADEMTGRLKMNPIAVALAVVDTSQISR